MPKDMEKIVSLCKRRGFLFQSSEIYGGLNGFWDYGPLGVELKRNVKETWWRDMITAHDDLATLPGAPSAYEMVGLDSTIIMHPQVWKCSGHFDLFHDMKVECDKCNSRFRADHVVVHFGQAKREPAGSDVYIPVACETEMPDEADCEFTERKRKRLHRHTLEVAKALGLHPAIGSIEGNFAQLPLPQYRSLLFAGFGEQSPPEPALPHCPKSGCAGVLSEPREFNLMFKTIVGALGTEDDAAFLRPETAQGIFVNFKNVLDSTRVSIPFGIAQVGKSFRNEITPRNFTFRSREFEQMEIEFFCHPSTSLGWYKYWRDRRYQWYVDLGLAGERLRLRDHDPEELSHYSCGTADIEYAFPFLAAGEFGELEGIAHRGDFDLRSHMEGKLVHQDASDPKSPLVLEQVADADGKLRPKYKGSGRDLTYFDDQTRERYTPHVIEPSAGADRATLAFLCEAYTEDTAPDEHGKPTERVLLKLHPRLAPIKAAVFPLVKKDGMPEIAQRIYRDLKKQFNVFYDEKGAVGRRYRRQDEAGTPYCITVDSQTLADQTVTFRNRDTLEQWRVKVDDCVEELSKRLR